MPFGAIAGAIAAGRSGRRPRPIGGPGKGRRPGRKLTTSQAAIRRFEMMKRRRKQDQGTGRPSRPSRPRSPLTKIKRAEGRPAGGRQRTSRTSQIAINRSKNRLGPTPSKGRTRTTSQAAIARFKAMRGRRRRR